MILLKTDRSEIGRQLHMSFRRPFLKTGNTLATLNLSGTTPVAKDALNIVSKDFDITVFKSQRILDGIL